MSFGEFHLPEKEQQISVVFVKKKKKEHCELSLF